MHLNVSPGNFPTRSVLRPDQVWLTSDPLSYVELECL